MPEYVVNKTIEGLNNEGKALKGANLLIVGLAYKPNVDDLRESPSLNLLKRYEELGAEINYHDPYTPVIPKTRKYGQLAGRRSVPLTNLDSYDGIIIATNHKRVDHFALMKADTVIIDTRNALAGASGKARVIKA